MKPFTHILLFCFLFGCGNWEEGVYRKTGQNIYEKGVLMYFDKHLYFFPIRNSEIKKWTKGNFPRAGRHELNGFRIDVFKKGLDLEKVIFGMDKMGMKFFLCDPGWVSMDNLTTGYELGEVSLGLAEVNYTMHSPRAIDEKRLSDVFNRCFQLKAESFIQFNYVIVNETVNEIRLVGH